MPPGFIVGTGGVQSSPGGHPPEEFVFHALPQYWVLPAGHCSAPVHDPSQQVPPLGQSLLPVQPQKPPCAGAGLGTQVEPTGHMGEASEQYCCAMGEHWPIGEHVPLQQTPFGQSSPTQV
jgi:hypothetical protein